MPKKKRPGTERDKQAAACLRGAGYSATELRSAGYPVTVIKALGYASPVIVAPLTYASLIWSIGIGFALFGDLPDGTTLLGAALIAGSGLYVFHRERVRSEEAG